MKLNKTHKEAIVRAVMQDLPRTDRNKAKETIKKMVTEDVNKFAPKQIAEIWGKPELACYLNITNSNVGYLASRGYINNLFEVSYPYKHEFSAGFVAEVTAIVDQLKDEAEAVNQARQKLETALAGVSTRKQLVDMFPEFEKYAPEEFTRSTLLPAVANVVADLSKLGWPKDKTVPA